MKKKLFSVFTLLLTATAAWADVTINETTFPDENFRNWVLSQEYGADGVLTDDEIANVTSMFFVGKNIQNLQGIEYFTALTNLSCGSNQLTSLDVSRNTALTYLGCNNNQLTSLDVSKNTALTSLNCGSNQLTSLDVSKNTALEQLQCYENQLTTLNLSNNTALTRIYCYQNQIRGTAMDALLQSLPTVTNQWGGELNVVYYRDEGNGMTTTQVEAAKVKNWKPRYSSGSSWRDFAGIDPDATDVTINETNFPDQNFRNWVLVQSYGKDGVLTPMEAAFVTSVYVSYENIQNLKGIEYFTAMTSLSCNGNQLTSLDVSQNTALTSLNCDGNQLTSLDVSNNTNLKSLNCYDNQLTSLELSTCPALTALTCYNNQLSSLDLSNCPALTALTCYKNQLASLDVSGCPEMSYLDCGSNQLTLLDLSQNAKLGNLTCSGNRLSSLDVSGCTRITSIYCSGNLFDIQGTDGLIGSLPVTTSGKLNIYSGSDESNYIMTIAQAAAAREKGWAAYFNNGSGWQEFEGRDPAVGNMAINSTNFPDANFRNYLLSQSYGTDGMLTVAEQIGVSNIDVRNKGIYNLKGIEYFVTLKTLLCGSNYLTSLDVSKNTSLTSISCDGNKLTSLDVSKNIKLTTLSCRENQLTSLDLSKNAALKDLYCPNNSLTSLILPENNTISTLSCEKNQLTSLDVSECSSVYYLACGENQLTSLDVSGKNMLRTLWCNNGQLTSVNLSGTTALEEIQCGVNKLASLDLSECASLKTLNCVLNELTLLDVSKNTKLETLNCGNNQLTSLNVSGCTALTYLDCTSNQFTSLDVSECTALYEFWCGLNQLTTLDLSKNSSLVKLYCYGNKIKNAGMDSLIKNLPTYPYSYANIYVIANINEGNIMTTVQVTAANEKHWRPYYNTGGSTWKDYAGSEPSSIEQCETPTISLVDGNIVFGCETEGVEYVYEVKCADASKGSGETVSLTKTYTVSVYAKKAGYDNSDVAIKEINVGGSGIRGDVNEDGQVNGTDIQEVINVIVNAD